MKALCLKILEVLGKHFMLLNVLHSLRTKALGYIVLTDCGRRDSVATEHFQKPIAMLMSMWCRAEKGYNIAVMYTALK